MFSVPYSLLLAFGQPVNFYRNPSFGIEMRYPSDWKYLPPHIDNKSLLIVFQPPYSNTVPTYLKLSIKYTNSTLSQFTYIIYNIKRDIIDNLHAKIMDSNDTTLAGYPAHQLAGLLEDSNQHLLKVVDTWTIQYAKEYRITLYSPVERFPYESHLLRDMLNSFKITK